MPVGDNGTVIGIMARGLKPANCDNGYRICIEFIGIHVITLNKMWVQVWCIVIKSRVRHNEIWLISFFAQCDVTSLSIKLNMI